MRIEILLVHIFARKKEYKSVGPEICFSSNLCVPVGSCCFPCYLSYVFRFASIRTLVHAIGYFCMLIGKHENRQAVKPDVASVFYVLFN